jgi:6-phosphogluconolactonase (cycloisomerase 2 family)
MRKIVLLIGLMTVITVSCNKLPFNDHFSEVVYIQNNNYFKGDNAIIAYRNNGDGKLTPILGGPFFTGGSGIGNPQQIEGPNNSDNEIRISNDRKFLLAVNSGSNTIAVFKINIDGTLSPVPGSPFPSGGETPVSIDMWQQYVYVANKSQNPITPTTSNPNFTVLKLEGDGSLVPVDTLEVLAGTSPAAIQVSKKFGIAYTTRYLGVRGSGPARFVFDAYLTDNTGTLSPYGASSSSYSARPQGIWESPSSNIVYVASSKGTLPGVIDLLDVGPRSGSSIPYYPGLTGYIKAGRGACCVRTNNTGDHLYVLNGDENSVSVYNSSTAAAPDSLQKLTLKNVGPTYTIFSGTYTCTTSGCMSMGLSSNEKFLYVVSQHTNPDFNVGNYNYLHVLSIKADGTVEEPDEPIQLPVQNTVRPRGVAVYRVN